jgi:regulatory protein
LDNLNNPEKPKECLSGGGRADKIALRLIARAEQCSAGLARKLEKRGCEPSGIKEAIAHLTEQGLINDGRFARLWLQSRLRLPRTPKRLLASLCARGIPRNEAQTALDDVLNEETELAMLERFAKKYAKKAGNQLKYILKSEGFSGQGIDNYFHKPIA